MSNLQQLALNLCLKDNASFENFYVGKNELLLKYLQSFIKDPQSNFVYFWGAAGVGKSHLLAACCQTFDDVSYLPLRDFAELQPQALENLENYSLLAIDDLDSVLGRREWEEAIFHCFNKFVAQGGRLAVTAKAAPQALQFMLPDLQSRMASAAIFQLHILDDAEKAAALTERAKLRGIELPDNVVAFLLNNYARDTASLFATLEKLDKASLQAQRKLTIPFIKEQFGKKYE